MQVGHLVEDILAFWVFMLTGLFVYKLLTGKINLRGIISDGSGAFSPERAQLLMAAVVS
jgi:hypothetical protein